MIVASLSCAHPSSKISGRLTADSLPKVKISLNLPRRDARRTCYRQYLEQRERSVACWRVWITTFLQRLDVYWRTSISSINVILNGLWTKLLQRRRRARCQGLLAQERSFDFVWVDRPFQHNSAPDAVTARAHTSVPTTLSHVARMALPQLVPESDLLVPLPRRCVRCGIGPHNDHPSGKCGSCRANVKAHDPRMPPDPAGSVSASVDSAAVLTHAAGLGSNSAASAQTADSGLRAARARASSNDPSPDTTRIVVKQQHPPRPPLQSTGTAAGVRRSLSLSSTLESKRTALAAPAEAVDLTLSANDAPPEGEREADRLRRYDWLPLLQLSSREKDVIQYGDELNDEVMNAALCVMKAQFPYVNGFQNTLRGHCPVGFVYEAEESIQMIHTGERHWVTISSIGERSHGYVSVYDSMARATDNRAAAGRLVRQQLRDLYWHGDRRPEPRYIRVQQQVGGIDCGLFAIANAVSLCFGVNPSGCRYNQPLMRSHLMTCLEQSIFTQFPS